MKFKKKKSHGNDVTSYFKNNNGSSYTNSKGAGQELNRKRVTTKDTDYSITTKWRLFWEPEDTFPALTPWIVMLVTLVIRVFYVIDPSSWWVLHPDEVFQSMEVAHSQVYGYGFRPYEFIAPSKGSNLSHYQQREMMLGMNALRSSVVPHIYATVAAMATWSGCQGNPFLMWRIMHVVITSTLPLAVYLYVKATGKPHDVASGAAILTAASSHLNVFGTHTIINSFLSPFLFLSMSRVFYVLKIAALPKENQPHTHTQNQNIKEDLSIQKSTSSSSHKNQNKKKARLVSQKNVSYSDKNGEINVLFVDLMKNKSNNFFVEVDRQHSFSKDSGRGESIRSGSESGGQSYDDEEEKRTSTSENGGRKKIERNVNNNYRSCCVRRRMKVKDGRIGDADDGGGGGGDDDSVFYCTHRKSDSWSNSSIEEVNCEEEDEGNGGEEIFQNETLRAVMKSNEKEMDGTPEYNPSTCMQDTDSKSCRIDDTEANTVANKLYVVLRDIISAINNADNVITFCAGFGLVLCVYVRPDSTLLVTLLALGHAHLTQLPHLLVTKSTWVLILGGAVALITAVLEDIDFYRGLVISPWQWTKFNLLSTIPSKLFGTLESSFYLENVYFGNLAMGILSLFFIASLCSTFVSCARAISGFYQNQKRSPVGFTELEETKKSQLDKRDEKTSGDGDITSNAKCEGTLYTDSWHAVTVVVMTTVYSLLGHKEERFLHDVIVLYFLVVASFLTSLFSAVFSSSLFQRGTIQFHKFNSAKRLAITTLLLLFSFNQWNAMPTGKGSDVNECLHYVSQQRIVSGVFLDSHYPDTFSYSILHKEVPLLTPMQLEYLEFHPQYFTTTKRSCLGYLPENTKSCTIRYTGLNLVANLIINSNAESVIKLVIDSPHYNYAIIRSTSGQTNFFDPAFQVVFRTKSATVWKRTHNPEHEKKLRGLSSGIPVGGRNTTLLAYEAEVLKQLGNYHVAASKFKVVLSRPEGLKASTMSSLAYCFHRMGMDNDAKRMIEGCNKLFATELCLSGSEPKVRELGVI